MYGNTKGRRERAHKNEEMSTAIYCLTREMNG
jgi:hypothetical protein